MTGRRLSRGWEFGVSERIKAKADKDFQKSVDANDEKVRKETTFVFVTPRRWRGKEAWVEAAKATRNWKDVRAYDASDLEQWLEQSLSAQAWFANETNMPVQDVRSLDRCWSDWANVSEPPLTGALFSSAIEATKRTMVSLLSKPSEGPIIIAADSSEEALAFVAQLLSECDLTDYRDRVLVFDKPGILPRLAQGAQTFIPIVFTREVERELGPYGKSLQAIVIYPRNVAGVQPHIVLEPANHETFNKTLEEMGLDRDKINCLANESGRSLTVLRRRLATVPAVRTPYWSGDKGVARSLVPFLFVGSWHSTNATDRLGLSLLSGDRPYDELEKEIQTLAQLNDSPVWSIGSYRGIVSKIDLLCAIADVVTNDDLDRYFSMAEMVLDEDDPALDLDEDKRWAASIYGKTREFSGAFREGICETLVLLAVHGGPLFQKRLGIDPEVQVSKVVRRLLTPLDARVLEASDRDLPTYAEAAPDEFLSILERDLKTDSPVTLGLLRPAAGGVFGRSPSRTGLLWALEGLAWSPQTFPRAVSILARLAQVEIKDNWANKPTHSLQSIFRAWMPQTAATHDARVEMMKSLAERFPDVAWQICVSQFGTYDSIGDYTHKPRWRPDGFGYGQPFPTLEPILKFRREMIEMALNWDDHTLGTIGDLIERIHDLDDDDRTRVWKLVETWARTKASDSEKAELREKFRVTIFSRRAAIRSKKDASVAVLTGKAKAAYAVLEPSGLLNKHAWLFRESWIEESADELEDMEAIDFRMRDERVKNMRVEAMREIRNELGLPALLELAERGNASWHLGYLAAREPDLLSEKDVVDLLRLAIQPMLEGNELSNASKNVVSGALQAVPNEKRERILKSVATGLSEEDFAHLLLLAPFCTSTWRLVDALGDAPQAKYWFDAEPAPIRESDIENNEGVERLLKVGRPRAAFACIRSYPEKVDAHVLFRILSAIAVGGNEKPGDHALEYYHLEQAFKHLDASPLLMLDQKAGLEFAYLDLLARPPHDRADAYGIPNLERYIELHPEAFVQAIAWAYKRNDGATDAADLNLPLDQQKKLAERGYKLLDAIERIPGHDDLGELQADRLANWVAKVRQASAESSRAEIADLCIGKMLSNAPVGKDGVWPCEPVRDIIENIQSEAMMEGAQNGVYNSRGAHWRGEGGDQERELEEKYRRWAQSLRFSHPYVSSKLLMGLAQTYEHQAKREDIEADIRRRLR